MCLPRVCSLILSIVINVPLVGFVLSLNQGTWEFKLFAIPFAISPVMAMVIFCNRRGSCLSHTALFLLLLSLVVKGVGATFAGLAIAATSTINSVFGRLGVIVYALVMGIFLISGLSDLYLFCTEIYRTSKEPKRELIRSSDLFA